MVERKVQEILLEILDVTAEDIVPTARFIHDLHATSLDLVDILVAFENTFDVTITAEEAARIETVQDAIAVLKTAMARKETASNQIC